MILREDIALQNTLLHAVKATVVWQHCNLCLILDVGRSYARMIKFQKRYFIEALENKETNKGHQQNAHMYFSHFQTHLCDESALSRFEVLTKPIHRCNEVALITQHKIKMFFPISRRA